MADRLARRGFLRGLAHLPLIGGGVTILGNPTAAAEPVTEQLLDAYSEWLFYECRLLCLERWPDNPKAERFIPAGTGASGFHFPAYPTSWRDATQPSTRATVVLSAVGCGWCEGPFTGR